MVGTEGPTIMEARIWESKDSVKTINMSGLGYSDGTGGQSDIVTSLRPTAFGIATFDFLLGDDGVPRATSIAVIGGETPGR